jgi:tetratricopeptide (TPR) repeat protein
MPVDPEAARSKFQAVVDGDPDRTTPASMVAGNLLVALDESKVKTPDLVFLSNELSRQRLPQIAAAVGGVLLVRDPKSIGGRLVLAAVYDGLQYFDLSREALREAERIFEEDPAASAPYTKMDLIGSTGRSYFTEGDYQKVIELFEGSGDPERFRFPLALSHDRLGNYDKAFAYFTRILEAGEPEVQVLQASEYLAKPEYAEFVNEP